MFPAGMLYDSQHPTSAVESKEQQDEPDPPRNFTLQQLTQFNGAKDEKSGTENPVYLSLNGIVFDVSKGRYVLIMCDSIWLLYLYCIIVFH